MRLITILFATLVAACSPNPSPVDNDGGDTNDTGPILTDGGTDDTGDGGDSDGGSDDGGSTDPPQPDIDEGDWCTNTGDCAPVNTVTAEGAGNFPVLGWGTWSEPLTAEPPWTWESEWGTIIFNSARQGDVVTDLGFETVEWPNAPN